MRDRTMTGVSRVLFLLGDAPVHAELKIDNTGSPDCRVRTRGRVSVRKVDNTLIVDCRPEPTGRRISVKNTGDAFATGVGSVANSGVYYGDDDSTQVDPDSYEYGRPTKELTVSNAPVWDLRRSVVVVTIPAGIGFCSA